MNVMQHDCVAVWSAQKLKLCRQVTPDAAQRQVMLERKTVPVS